MKRVIAFFLIFGVILLCGCYDSREIDETAYIIAIGIDDGGNAGFSYTFQFAAPLAISGEGGGEEEGNPGVKNIPIKARDFYIARNMLNNSLSKNIDMSHLKMIVFSSSVEDSDLMLHSQLFRRERQIRPHTAVAVAESSAEDFLGSVNPLLEANTAKYYELMSLRSNNIYAPSARLYGFADRLCEGRSCVLPLAHGSSELKGMVIFTGSASVGTMDGDSALIYNILRRDIQKFTLSLENPNEKSSMMTFNVAIPSRAHYIVEQKNNHPQITVRQSLVPEYIGEGLPKGYKTEAELLEDFRNMLSKRIQSFFYASSRELGADIMETGDYVKQGCITLDEWDIKKWNSAYKNAEFRIEIDI